MTPARWPLRVRVSIAYGLMGLVLSVGFAIATMLLAEDYEAILIRSLLEGQARSYLDRVQADPTAALPVSATFAGYREQDAPAEYRGMPNGIHDLDLGDGRGMHVGIVGEPGARLVFLVDVGRVETLEQYLVRVMLVVVLGGTIVSAWLGWLLAQRTIAPVTRLAGDVAALPPRPMPTTLATRFGRDEIGRLAGAIDDYQQRLSEIDALDRRFFADASHELRTPIAVIQGAVEVMRDDPALAGQGARMDRIDRALLELGSLLEALLLSARRQPGDAEAIALAPLADEVLARLEVAVPDCRQRLVVSAGTLLAPRRWLASILTVLLQRVLLRTPGTRWTLSHAADGLALACIDGEPVDAGDGGRSDLGLGLMFVERLCRDLGWHLEQGRGDDGRVRLRIGGIPPA